MKLQELHEAAGSAIDTIVRALSGIKGVKVTAAKSDFDDLDGNALPETYLVKVTYTPSRGVKPTETIKLYKTADGDWEYLNDVISGAADALENLLPELRKELETAQKFHGKSAAVDESTLVEGYEAKVLAVLKDFPSAYFENGVLWTSEDEYEGVLQATKEAAKREGFKAPTVRIDIDIRDVMKPKVGDRR